MKDFLEAVTQLSLNNSPISLSEMRELVLRHLLSDPNNLHKRSVSRNLLTAYVNMLTKEHPNWNRKPNSASPVLTSDVDVFFLAHYNEGLVYGAEEEGVILATITGDAMQVWPKTLPPDMDYYPKDIVAQFAAVMGYLATRGKEIEQSA